MFSQSSSRISEINESGYIAVPVQEFGLRGTRAVQAAEMVTRYQALISRNSSLANTTSPPIYPMYWGDQTAEALLPEFRAYLLESLAELDRLVDLLSQGKQRGRGAVGASFVTAYLLLCGSLSRSRFAFLTCSLCRLRGSLTPTRRRGTWLAHPPRKLCRPSSHSN